MGIGLVQEVQHPGWAFLETPARFVLSIMAARCYDKPTDGKEAGLYYGGHAELVFSWLGVPKDSPDYPKAERRVKRVIAQLLEAGAIERKRHAVNGRRAEYRVTTSRPPLPVDK